MKRDLIAGLVGQEAVARLMHGWLLVLPLVNLILADAVVWFVITQVWRPTGAAVSALVSICERRVIYWPQVYAPCPSPK